MDMERVWLKSGLGLGSDREWGRLGQLKEVRRLGFLEFGED